MDKFRHRVGRAMSRRDALSLIGAAACSLVPFDPARAADTNSRLSCVATPTQTEGPYFVDERLDRADIRGGPAGGRGYAFTSQLYFDEATSDRVYARAPYAGTVRRTRNDADFIYRSGGKELTLALVPDSSGYAARFDVGLRMA